MKPIDKAVRLRKQSLDGHVEMMLLAILNSRPSYGYAIVRTLQERSGGLVQLGESTVYPVLHRLKGRGLLTVKRRTAENGRSRKYYRLTAKGRRALAADRQQWRILSAATKGILGRRG